MSPEFEEEMREVADARQAEHDRWHQVVESIKFLREHLVSVMQDSVDGLKNDDEWNGWYFGPSFPGNEQAERDLKWAASLIRPTSALFSWACEWRARKANVLAVLRNEKVSVSLRNPYPQDWT